MKARNSIILTTSALVCVFLLAAALADVPKPAGQVEEILGQVEAKTGDASPRLLAKGGPVFAQDVITTKTDKDKAKIKFADDSVLEVGPSSVCALADYAFDEADAANSKQSITMGKGLFRLVTGKIVAQNPDNLVVKSPLSVVGIRGTTTDHWIQATEKTQAGKPVMEVQAELHALRATKTSTQVIVQTETERLVLTKPDEVAWVRPKLPGMVRALSEEEKQNFAKTPFQREPFDPAPRRGMTGGSGG